MGRSFPAIVAGMLRPQFCTPQLPADNSANVLLLYVRDGWYSLRSVFRQHRLLVCVFLAGTHVGVSASREVSATELSYRGRDSGGTRLLAR